MKRRFDSYTPAEDAIIREHYPGGGYKAVQKLLPKRGERSLRYRAMTIGVSTGRKVKKGAWEDIEQDEIYRRAAEIRREREATEAA